MDETENETPSPERNAEIARRYADPSERVADIGKDFGISYQRVRQIAEAQGVPPREQRLSVDPVEAERVLANDPEIASAKALAKALGASVPALRRSLVEAGMVEDINARLIARRAGLADSRNRAAKQRMLAKMVALANRLGYTPGTHDLNAEGSDTPVHTTYVKHFGSLTAAQEAAGLTPNGTGAPGHARQKQAAAADIESAADLSTV